MEKKYTLLLSIIFCFCFSLAFSQESDETNDETYDESYDESYEESYEDYYQEAEFLSEDISRKVEFTIPSAPAFSLMGVTPEMVTRPGTVQDFKVDWRIKNYNLAPDLALEMQPLWALYYDRKGLDAYRNASPFMKTLSTLSLSFGTAKMDGVNHFSYAFKLNLFREKDPVNDPALLKEMAIELADLEEPLKNKMNRLRSQLDSTVNREDRMLIREEMFNTRSEIRDVQRAQKERLMDVQQSFMQEHWNASYVDIAFGKVHTYNNDFDSLNIKGAGYGFWLNGSKGLGQQSLLTGILKVKKVGQNTNFMLGTGYRFGGYRFSFYGELVYESLRNLSENGISEDEFFASKFSEDLGTGWIEFNEPLESVSQWSLSYGGDFRLSNGILLNFALRTRLDQKFKFKKLIPVANVTCLMR